MKTVIIHPPFQQHTSSLAIINPVTCQERRIRIPVPLSGLMWLHFMELIPHHETVGFIPLVCWIKVFTWMHWDKKEVRGSGSSHSVEYFTCPVSCHTCHSPIISQLVVSCVNYQTQWWSRFQFYRKVCKLAMFFLIKPSAYSKGSRTAVLVGTGVNLFPGGALRCPSSSGDSSSA